MKDQMSGIQGAVSQLSQANEQAVNDDLEKRKKLLKDYLNQPPPDSQIPISAVTQALGQIDNKSTPGKIGQSIQTPAYAGYCLQYVDDQQGNSQRYPTAYADYQARASQGNIKTSGDIPKGARVYFAPDQSNGNMGHVGISLGDGKFRSATDNGIKDFSLKDWQKYTGQSFIGWSK